jgi:hypothetical protein
VSVCEVNNNACRFPVYILEDDNHCYYGLPIHGNSGVKIGLDAAGPLVTPDTRGFVPDPVREQTCTNFLRKYLPQVNVLLILQNSVFNALLHLLWLYHVVH